MRCELVVKGRVCGMSCLSLSSLNMHLSEHLDQLSLPTNSQTRTTDKYKCPWYKCKFSIDSHDSIPLKLHVYFHVFQLGLQNAGSKYRKEKNLSACHIRPSPAIQSLLQPFTCQWFAGKCKQEFHLPADFYLHVWEHGSCARANEGTRQLECKWDRCKYKIAKRHSLQTHLRKHTQEKVIACPTCYRQFATNPNFEDHLHRQAPCSSLYACDICHKQFPTERLLKAHLNKHINNIQCSLCGFTMLDESHLKRHMLYKHSNKRTQVCQHCSKTYKSKDVLERHLAVSHSLTKSVVSNGYTEKPYRCHLCDKKYKISSFLGRHLSKDHKLSSESLHPKLKRFKFVRYEDGFFRVALNTHLQSLSSAKPPSYKCHVCQCRFPLGKLLSLHLIAAHGFSLPKGYSRFRYLKNSEGFHELVMFRIESKALHSED